MKSPINKGEFMNVELYENGFSTAQLASASLSTPGTVRVRYCQTGSYFGLVPLKLPNGRLLWPRDSLERLAAYRKPEAA